MTRSVHFAQTVRHGARSGRDALVVHLARPAETGEPRAGFIVSKAVGSAVVRNRVKRRLRAVVARHVDALPAGAHLVVRALPPAASAPSGDLERQLVAALGAAASRLAVPA